ncbi:MAG: MAPEG family protein [Alphaproteobacteria bacterium]|nr:MAPEG family protein [Alphaproteobacteria bacterium]
MYVYASLATIAALTLYTVLCFKVGSARGKYAVPAPATDGPPEFLRYLRVQMNTLEQIVVALPAIWLCAIWVGDPWAGIGGAVWIAGRALYARGYYADPKKRGAGFMIAMFASTAMLLAALVAIFRA